MAIDPNSEAALKTIDIQQSLIARMSNASASAKNWCVTVVSAVSIVAVEKGNSQFVIIACFPTILFAASDIYYLSLERAVRALHNSFSTRLRNGVAEPHDLFNVGTPTLSFGDTFSSALSKSIWPFYSMVFISLIAVAMIASAN